MGGKREGGVLVWFHAHGRVGVLPALFLFPRLWGASCSGFVRGDVSRPTGWE